MAYFLTKQIMNSFIVQYLLVFSSLTIITSVSCFLNSFMKIFGTLIVVSFTSWFIIKLIGHHFMRSYISSMGKAVLITGCDSGFGHRLALELNNYGFKVYATCLNPNSSESQNLLLNAIFPNNIKILKMDVTNDGEVTEAFNEINCELQRNGEELWALINNSGIMTYGIIEWGSMDSYQNILDVNTFGMVRVTRTFLPLIRKSKGRIVNVSSILGRVTIGRLTAYCMSKYAVISFSDALRREMHRWGVKVSTIEPELYKTPISAKENINKTLDREWSETPSHIKQTYGLQYFQAVKRMAFQWDFLQRDPKEVVDSMIDAVRNNYPKISYRPGGLINKLVIFAIEYILPDQLFDTIYCFGFKHYEKLN